LILTLTVLILLSPGLRHSTGAHRIWTDLAGPWLVLSFLFLVLPFSRLEAGALYYGVDSAVQSFQILMEYSLGERRLPVAATSAFAGITIAASLLTLAGLAFPRRMKLGGSGRSRACAMLSTGTLLTTVLGMVAAHAWFGILYPWGRTGIFLLLLIPMAWLSCASVWNQLAPRFPGHTIRAVCLAGLAAVALAMIFGIHPNYFMEWRFDASTREILDEIDMRRPASGSVRIFAVPPLQNTLRLYRDLRHMDWIESIEPDIWDPAAHFYVLGAADVDPGNPASVLTDPARFDFEILYRSGLAGVVLAVRPSSAPASAEGLDPAPPAK
jgi:hypothetical protein